MNIHINIIVSTVIDENELYVRMTLFMFKDNKWYLKKKKGNVLKWDTHCLQKNLAQYVFLR